MPQENQTSLKDETELNLAEKWKNATIANNMQTEETIEVDYDKKGVRLDVYAENATKAYNLEMQATDNAEIPERARYYQGILDVQALNQGAEYKDLKDSYVIFICVPDIFEKGLAKYTFENLCLENPQIKLNDRAYKYFFIAKNYDKILDEKQKAFLKLVMTPGDKGNNSFTEKVSRLVEEAKQNSLWRKQFMDLEREKARKFREGKEEGLREGKAEGLLEGAQQKAIEAAIEFLKEKIPPETIAKCVKLPLEKVLELQKEILVHS